MNDRVAGIPACPICDGRMEVVYDRHHQIVAVCIDCHTGLTIPRGAREILRLKRDGEGTAPAADS